ncbi:hypothetical protein COL922a_007660 [Colletotrichum nupharicola]|nr:hypothetical protein COL922a_007660 [Colletotrichum nupharicola]
MALILPAPETILATVAAVLAALELLWAMRTLKTASLMTSAPTSTALAAVQDRSMSKPIIGGCDDFVNIMS